MLSIRPFLSSLLLISNGISVLGYTSSYTPQTIEVDLIFPRNDTYTPLDFFPLVWGLQNANAAWPLGLLLEWLLFPVGVAVAEEAGGFPPAGYSQDTDFFSSGPPPTDPVFFYTFPRGLRNFQPGHWRLEWRVGFEKNCSADDQLMDDHFLLQKRKAITFTIGDEGKAVDLLANRTCGTEQATTFRVIDSFEWGGMNCPVVGTPVPKANPCKLPFNETTVEEITAVARGLGHCASGSLVDLNSDCKRSGGSRIIPWWGVAAVVFHFSCLGVFFFLGSL